MRVFVVVSDCGLNGVWVHGVFTERPAEAALETFALEVQRTTGYQNTEVWEFDLDGELIKKPW